MIRNLLLTLLYTTSLWATEEIYTGKVHSVIPGEENYPHIIQLTSGRALYLPRPKNSVHESRSLALEGKKIEAVVDSRGTIKKFKFLGREENEEVPVRERSTESFTPTILAHSSDVRDMFERLNHRYQRVSQCTNRALIWAWEEYKNHGIQSMKAFIFFTKSYLWENQFPWWFHVAPMISTRNGQEWVLDYRYSLRPSSLKEWADLFVYSKRSCPVVDKYSDYRNHQQEEHCYLIKRSMFYWQPMDIEKEESSGELKTDFIQQEIEWAYKEAF